MRSVNADAVFANDATGVYAVADGVGSTPPSVAASALAIELAVQAAESDPTGALGDLIDPIYDHYRLAFDTALPPSTTLSLLRLSGASLDFINIGDSPIFLIEGAAVTLLTRNHTLIDQGRVVTSFSQLKSQNGANILVDALGPTRPKTMTYAPILLKPPCRLVVCSDGLLEVVSQEALGALSAAAPTAADLVERLLSRALGARPNDNFSGVIIDLSSSEDQP